MGFISAVVVAAGASRRMGGGANKTLLPLGGLPILGHVLASLEAMPLVPSVVVVTREEDFETVQALTVSVPAPKVIDVVPGGAERFDSVRAGLERFARETSPPERILIQDAARPFLQAAFVHRCQQALDHVPGAVVGVPAKDTIKRVDELNEVVETPQRESLRQIQTPQAFHFPVILDAYRSVIPPPYPTDDAEVLESTGQSVRIVEGSYENIKITTPEDQLLAERILDRMTQG